MVEEIAGLIPRGSISIEVYADLSTPAERMLEQGLDVFLDSQCAHKVSHLPGRPEGRRKTVREGLRINQTLCFSQEQAAAVYAATRGAKKGEVFVSPFIGRLDDRGENGMDLIAHIIRMYRPGDGHVEVLTASVRKRDHLLCALNLGSDIITAPFEILKQWGDEGLPLPEGGYRYDPGELKGIPFREIDLNQDWRAYDLATI